MYGEVEARTDALCVAPQGLITAAVLAREKAVWCFPCFWGAAGSVVLLVVVTGPSACGAVTSEEHSRLIHTAFTLGRVTAGIDSESHRS